MGCPMGFGELNIPSSRAFWDDDDEDEPTESSVVEKILLSYAAGQPNTPLSSELFLLIEGTHIAEFSNSTLLNGATKICDIPTSKKASALYSLVKSKILLAVIEEDLTSSGEVADLLLPYVKLAKQVVTISVKSKVDYKSENISNVRDAITFLRGINTQFSHIKELQAPNFIAGVGAGLASWRENEKLPISSYIAYTDNVSLDKLAAQPILNLLNDDLGIKCERTFKPKHKDNSHLYS